MTKLHNKQFLESTLPFLPKEHPMTIYQIIDQRSFFPVEIGEGGGGRGEGVLPI